MIQLDVNVLVYAHRADMPEHPVCKSLLDRLVSDNANFGVAEIAFSALVRIATQNIWKPPSTTAQALAFCNAVMSSQACLVLQPTERHWSIFEQLCRAVNARGKLAADAYLAAFAIDRGDEWVTTDRDFARFPGLRWRHPRESKSRVNP